MYQGYMGKILRVDLLNQRAEIQQLDEKLARNYVGGSGIGGRFLYDETTEQTHPLSCQQCGKPRSLGSRRFCRECRQYRKKDEQQGIEEG